MLIEAAQAGNEREVEECAKLFIDHAAKLEEVSLWKQKTQFWIFFLHTTKMKMMHKLHININTVVETILCRINLSKKHGPQIQL